MIEMDARPASSKQRLQYFYDAMKESKFTDVVFVVGDRSYPAHMAMLSASSEFFEKSEEHINEILSEFDYPVIDAIFKYCYLGEIQIEIEHYEEFLQLADRLHIKINDVRNEIIDKSNCLEVLSVSNDSMLKEKAMSLTLENFNNLYETPDFLNLSASILTDILKSDELNASAEEVFDSVKLWITYDEENRRCELVQLLGLVKYSRIPAELTVTELTDLCYPHSECNAIFKQAVEAIFKKFQSKLSIAEQTLKNCQFELSTVGKHVKTSLSKLSTAEDTLNSCKSKLSIVEQSLEDFQSSFQKEETVKNEKLVLVGDYEPLTASVIDVYDGKNNHWKLSQDYQLNRNDFASVLVDTWLLIIGGSGTRNVDYIDLKDGQKYQLKSLNQGRQWPSAAKIHHDSTIDVYAIGGIDSYENRNFLSSVERWNSKTKTWDSNIAPLLHAVYFHSASVIDNVIYVTGGRIKKNGEDTSTNIVQVYSVESNTWSYGTPMTVKRLQHSCISYKGRLYVGGGTTGETYDYLDSVESYDPNADIWTIYCKLPQPVRALSICFYRNKLLCMAGHDGQNFLSNVWEYDNDSENWKALKSLNKGRHYATAHVIPYDSVI